MKYFIGLIALTFAFTAQAGMTCSSTDEVITEQMLINTDVPKHLQGATITITQKDGKSSTVPAEKFKVVPRKQQYLVTKTSTKENCMKDDKHRVSVMVGKGPTEGLNRNDSNAPNQVTVESKLGTTGGLQYQYKPGGNFNILGHDLSIGGQIQSNKAAAGMIGLEF